MFIARREAKCSRPRRMRAGHDAFSHRHTTSSSGLTSALWQNGQRSRHLPRLRCRPAARSRRADDLRDDVAALFDEHEVAVADVAARDFLLVVQRRHLRSVVPLSRTGSSTANGVTAPVRPTLTSMRISRVVACSAGNLNATAQRGNFAVVPEPLAQRQIVELDDDAVGFELAAARRASRHSCAVGDHRVDAVAALPVRLDRTAPAREQLAATRRASRPAARAPPGIDDLIGEGAQAASRDRGRIERADGAGRRVARIGEHAARPPASRSSFMRSKRRARQVHLAANLRRDRRARRPSAAAASRESRGRSA